MNQFKFSNTKREDGFWIKNYANHLKVDESIKSKMDVFSFLMGYDHKVYNSDKNNIFLGLMAGYLYTDNIKTYNNSNIVGEGDAISPNIGAYLFWINNDGWFADMTIHNFWNKFSMTNYSSQGLDVNYKIKREFIGENVTIGRKLTFNIDESDYYSIEPKISLIHIYADSANFKTNTNREIKYGKTNSIKDQIGSKFIYSKKLSNGTIVEPFINFAITREFDGITNITYNGINYRSDLRDTRYEVGLGLDSKINNSWSIYGDINYEFSTIVESIIGSIGLRYDF
ncbi:autotransporter outer membrane beta-barrel domain-containing protein [Aliarcobacter butzleri]|nr:autotransporter outer membrane beta-barrel domain-containing protein [Aliarcobacter butzleri]MDN5100234.1 autotransporter outer membrane beta-barrel domain-containing protein [Aliarcobacter butzleri]